MPAGGELWEGRFPQPRSLTIRRVAGTEGASESQRRTAACLWQPQQQTDNCTDGAAALHSQAWHTCLPMLEGWMPGTWASGIGPGERTEVDCADSDRLRSGNAVNCGCRFTKRNPGPPDRPVTIVWGIGWWGTDCSLSFSLPRGRTLPSAGSRGGCQEWSQATSVSFRDSRSGLSYTHSHCMLRELCLNCHLRTPGVGISHCICLALSGDNDQHPWRKKTGNCTKTALASNILNPKKLQEQPHINSPPQPQ